MLGNIHAKLRQSQKYIWVEAIKEARKTLTKCVYGLGWFHIVVNFQTLSILGYQLVHGCVHVKELVV